MERGLYGDFSKRISRRYSTSSSFTFSYLSLTLTSCDSSLPSRLILCSFSLIGSAFAICFTWLPSLAALISISSLFLCSLRSLY